MKVEFTATAAAQYLGIKRRKFDTLLKLGKVRFLQIGKRRKFYKSDLDAVEL